MGRPRKPTAILDAKGSFIHDPQRARPNEPKPSGELGSPPKHLSRAEKKVWKEIAKRLAPGVAFACDRDAFEMLVRLTCWMRYGRVVADVPVPMTGSDRNTLISLWGRFGMTPADRSKVSAEKAPESPLASFIRRKRQPSQDSADLPN